MCPLTLLSHDDLVPDISRLGMTSATSLPAKPVPVISALFKLAR